jgi:hypothetical protein
MRTAVPIDDAARQAGRRVDPEHFGMGIGDTHQPLDDRQLATCRQAPTVRRPELSRTGCGVHPSALVSRLE